MDAQPAAVRTGKREGATPDTGTDILGAVGCRTTAAAAAEMPATGTEAATAEVAVPGATSAEVDAALAAARAATIPARAATATRWSAQLRMSQRCDHYQQSRIYHLKMFQFLQPIYFIFV